ncbi:hypothetical protein Agub_g7453, partial [Astrephomene gubernaculifera]
MLPCATAPGQVRTHTRCTPFHPTPWRPPMLHGLKTSPRHGRGYTCIAKLSEDTAMVQAFAEDGFLEPQEQLALSQTQRPASGRQAEIPMRAEGSEPDGADGRERVFLVGAAIKRADRAGAGAAAGGGGGSGVRQQQQRQQQQHHVYDVYESLEELGRLADTAGLRVMGSTVQLLESPNMATYIGSGKVAEVARAVAALDVDTVIFDDELSPAQLRNLEKQLSGAGGPDGATPARAVRVCDRTALILDIFSQRARTREGQLQVELAQVEYQLPRLTRMWSHLDRVGGGGQVKGAGEKQLELDKRLLRERAAGLRRELEAVRTHRRQYRERRAEVPVPVVGICGYTNAGKSTLLNTLTQAGVLAEDQLFATLDPTTRRLRLKGNREILLSDTVGFIQKLPTELVAAFRATLEEIRESSLLLHVVDISHPAAAAQSQAVMGVLRELGIRRLASRRTRTVCISGATGEGLPALLDLIASELEAALGMRAVRALLPYSAGDLLSELHAG